MQLKTINLKHLRSLKECTINISDVTELVGENNSGKSSLLRALNLFFNYEDEKSGLLSDRHGNNDGEESIQLCCKTEDTARARLKMLIL